MGIKQIKKCCEALFGNTQPKNSFKDSLIDEKFSYNKTTSIEDHIHNQYSSTRVTLDEFIIIKTLGKGSFGKVLLVRHKSSYNLFAMKVIKKDLIKQRNQKGHIRAEREILERVNFPFIIELVWAFQTPNKLYLITDFVPGGELFFHLRKVGFFNEDLTRFYAAEIILAIEYLHKSNIIYRDLKPENILIDEDGHIKLTDFGLSKVLRGTSNSSKSGKAFTICGTPEYLAPEILLGNGYDKAVDWWSLGALIYEMLVGYSPFRECKKKLDIGIYLRPITQHKNISDVAFDLIKKLLNTSPSSRLGGSVKDAEEIKNHAFFKTVNWAKLLRKEINAPFKPFIGKEEELRNFDKAFTQENPDTPKETIFMFSKPESGSTRNSKFEDFTYINTSILNNNNN